MLYLGSLSSLILKTAYASNEYNSFRIAKNLWNEKQNIIKHKVFGAYKIIDFEDKSTGRLIHEISMYCLWLHIRS